MIFSTILSTDWILPVLGGLKLIKVNMEEVCPYCGNTHKGMDVESTRGFLFKPSYYYVVCPITNEKISIVWS